MNKKIMVDNFSAQDRDRGLDFSELLKKMYIILLKENMYPNSNSNVFIVSHSLAS